MKIIENFLKIMIPHMTHGEFEDLTQNFGLNASIQSEHIELHDIAKMIYPMLIFKIERTVKSYIMRCVN